MKIDLIYLFCDQEIVNLDVETHLFPNKSALLKPLAL